ncbi:MAG: polysaccharide biosynthesis/export family protein [Qipengyuania sp.]|uniref:polysaccharide biosynthesis/export family protein n=1 Tax=Qipengyuania sp. TaxID=2004515 RepID=UPI0030033E51
MKRVGLLGPVLAALSLLSSACAGKIQQVARPISETPPSFDVARNSPNAETYRLGPMDVVSIRTFREADLTFDEVRIDASGAISFPIVGRIEVSGLTTFELAESIEQGLRQAYLRNPDVTVQIKEAVTNRFVIEGAVNQSGIFDLNRDTTLIEAVARARGTNDVASRSDVVIFRMVDGQRMGALFDLNAIERGYLDDPRIVAGDVIVVHIDGARRTYLDLLRASPLAAAVFRAI